MYANCHPPLAMCHSPLATRHSPLATRHLPLATCPSRLMPRPPSRSGDGSPRGEDRRTIPNWSSRRHCGHTPAR
ncbi:MAG: hypothetical protein EHJ95_05975 [Methanobacteriota archaeon]|nr:MAG: hypothetical protein EHJ95_05975 [Euryarchaeota archaeon]